MNPFSRLLVAAILVFGWGNWNSNAWSQGWLDHPIDGIPFVQNDLPSIHIECGDALEWIYEEANWYSNVEHPASRVDCEALLERRLEELEDQPMLYQFDQLDERKDFAQLRWKQCAQSDQFDRFEQRSIAVRSKGLVMTGRD